jgi:eukaryotic-like serine/threonine-protein kinase
MAELYLANLNVPKVIKEALIKFSEKYSLEREAEKGANGFLFFGKNKVLGTAIAIKIYYWGNDRKFHAEPQSLSLIRSANVIAVFDAGYIDESWAYFVTPYCSGGDVEDLLCGSAVGNLKAIALVAQILNGLSHLHAQRFLHRDLKPSNIYLDSVGSAVIGDFGSIVKLPEGQSTIPASSNSLLYRPPESIRSLEYGFTGDVYQVGIILYQLLGGYLPYEDTAWLSKHELSHFAQLVSHPDRSIYVDQCVNAKIARGKIIDIDHLPPWVCDQLKRVIRKACNNDPEKRFETAAHFLAQLNKIQSEVLDWKIADGYPMLNATTSYRVVEAQGIFSVQKRRGAAAWRNDSSIAERSLAEAVAAINIRQV